jgi:phosphopantothenoylcysteine decarboxylase/phosphopantothenate--cysteine ligase
MNILITAGPTVEDIDPVRFISNRASGKLGFALARAAAKAGHRVTLIHGPVAETVLLGAPKKAARVAVRSAAQMLAAVLEHVGVADVVIMNAAVADFTPAKVSAIKLKKAGARSMTLKLKPTVDILARLGRMRRQYPNLVLIGFALETGEGRTSAAREASRRAFAHRKLVEKRLDCVVLNTPMTIGAADGAFEVYYAGDRPEMPSLRFAVKKERFARELVKIAATLAGGKRPTLQR